jgi:hypothetical protein
LNFQQQKSLTNQFVPHFESKSYQINSIESCSSRSFQQHQRHIPIPPKFSVKNSFNIQELPHLKSKTPWNQAHAPLLLRAFQRDQEHDMKHPCSVDLISTKQNKQTNNLAS